MLSLLVALQAAPVPAPPEPPAQEIVVTARRDKCFVEYGQHPVSDRELETLSQNWALGTPVRVIEPRGTSLKCEFKIMQSLAAHGRHVAQFVARSEDLSPEDTKAEQAEIAAEKQKEAAQASAAAAAATPMSVPLTPAALAQQSVSMPIPARGRRAAPPTGRSVSQAPSGIVTLACTMADPVQPYQLDLIVNEEKGTVTPSRPDTGGGSEMKAVFMPDAVRFGPFTISRSSLHIRRQNAGNAAGGEKQPPVVEGQCALTELRRVF